MNTDFLESAIKQLEYYKLLGEQAITRVPDDKLNWTPNDESNSIPVIVKHMAGNMISRWTDFLSTDGEKPWRNRESEFDNDLHTRHEIIMKWNEGWEVCLSALRALQPADLTRIIYIRNQGHTVLEAINRQLAHYPYHVGQIIYIAKILAPAWHTLSIPRGASNTYNEKHFAQQKQRTHFTDEYLK